MIVITGRKRFYGACTVSRNQCRHILTNKDLKQKLPSWRKRGFNISSVVCLCACNGDPPNLLPCHQHQAGKRGGSTSRQWSVCVCATEIPPNPLPYHQHPYDARVKPTPSFIPCLLECMPKACPPESHALPSPLCTDAFGNRNPN